MNTAINALLPAPAMQNLHDPSGIGYADTLDPHVPLSVRVGPYLEIAAGDVIDLYCDDVLAFNYTVTPEDLTPGFFNFVVLSLDQKFIRQPQITLYYEVTKPIGGQKNQSTEAIVPVKLTLPGGTDTNPATPWENERLALAKVFPEGVIVSPEGVTVEIAAYMNMFVGDKIALSWHGEIIRTEITDELQVGQPLVIPVSREIIERAGDSDMLEVRYEMRDIVNNWSRWSLPTYVEVEAGDSTLPAPVTPQAPGMELDLDQLAGADVQVLVLAHGQIQRGDHLTLLVERNTAEGLMLETYSASMTISETTSFYEFQVPNAQFQPIAQGRARLRYRVEKAAGMALRSKSLPLRIIGQPMALPLPRVSAAEQNGGVLDPTSRNVRAEVPAYYFMSEGNDVHLYWMGKTATGANLMHDELKKVAAGDVGSPLDFHIPDDKVSLLAGGSVEVYYTVNTFGRAFFTSPSLNLQVSDEQLTPLPLPTIAEAQGDILDPANTANGVTVVIAASANLRQGDTVKVSWSGPKGSDEKEKAIGAGDAGNALSVVFASALVSANVGESVAVSYQVTRSNGTVQDSDVFSVRVQGSLSFDTSAVTLDGKVYLVPAHPEAQPQMPAGTTVERQASGGTAPYSYRSSDPLVAHVSNVGLVSVRGRGTSTISVTDATGQSLSFQVTVNGVVHCIGLSGGKFGDVGAQASANGARLPSIEELREIHGMWAGNWPLVKNLHWSSTPAKVTPFGKTYYQKSLANGVELDAYTYSSTPAIGVR